MVIVSSLLTMYFVYRTKAMMTNTIRVLIEQIMAYFQLGSRLTAKFTIRLDKSNNVYVQLLLSLFRIVKKFNQKATIYKLKKNIE